MVIKMSMLIPIIIEPGYGSASIWCDEIRAGISAEAARKKYAVEYIDGGDYRRYDYAGLFSDPTSPHMVTLIGTSHSWIPEALDFFAGCGIDVLLVSYQPPEGAPVRGVVRVDYVAGCEALLRHLGECGCECPALYGGFQNSSADIIKRRAFDEFTAGSGMFRKTGSFDNISGLADCFDSFRQHIGEFDSVLCVNDIAAASLINRLRAEGIRVPEELQVVCFGSSEIARLYRPSITALSLNNQEQGRQAVSVYSYLARADADVKLSVRVGGELIVRESTRPADNARSISFSRPRSTASSSFYDDGEVKAFTTFEKLLLCCDELDLSLIGCMLDNVTTERIAERLNLAPETVRYRVRRILSSAGMKSRAELLEYIRGNDFGSVFSADGNL